MSTNSTSLSENKESSGATVDFRNFSAGLREGSLIKYKDKHDYYIIINRVGNLW